MKKFLVFLLSLMIIMLCFGCGEKPAGVINSADNTENGSTSILTDKKFKNGFAVRGLGEPIYPEHAAEETYGTDKIGTVCLFQYDKTGLDYPSWNLTQWSTRYPFQNPAITSFKELGSGIYEYKNLSKYFKVDTNTGEAALGLKASECYVYGNRVWGQEWPHMLIERTISNQTAPSPFTKVSDKEKIVASVSARLNSFTDNMNGEANPGLHAAQLLFYIYLSNRNPNTNTFDDMIWFGIPIFDNRTAYAEQIDFVDSGTKGSATEKYIYNLGVDTYLSDDNNFWENGQIVSGADSKWVNVSVDIMPYVQTALSRAQSADCMMSSSYENLYINGMYIGFELPGNYDIEMSLKNLDIRVY